MSESLAYLAGLVDGEGSLGLEPQSGARFRGPYLSIQADEAEESTTPMRRSGRLGVTELLA